MITSTIASEQPAIATVCDLSSIMLRAAADSHVKLFKIGASRLGLLYPTKVMSDDWAVVLDLYDEDRVRYLLDRNGYVLRTIECSSDGYEVVVCTRGANKHVLIVFQPHAEHYFSVYRRAWSRYVHACCRIALAADSDTPVFPPAPRVIFRADDSQA